MPRPSMANQRREEILDAFEKCILKEGIESTSLETLAEQAQMKRSILRHYIGNKDEIICALSERWMHRYQLQWQETLAFLPNEGRLMALVDILFAQREQEYIEGSIIGEAIFAQAKRLPEVKTHIQQTMAQFIEIVEQELAKAYPNAPADKITMVASGIHANYLMSESLLPLDMLGDIEVLKNTCALLIQQLHD